MTENSKYVEQDDDIIIEKMCCGCEIEEPEEIVTSHCTEETKQLESYRCVSEEKQKESCCEKPENQTLEKEAGCVVCGKKLVYKTTPSKETCSICGLLYDTTAKCVDGHFICDACHSGGILGKVEQLLLESTETNPVKLAENIFELPGLKMHGPEYHSIVPAVIVAAWQNMYGKKDVVKLKEAIRRGTDIKGGSCGFNGSCGAGSGSGIAASILKGATPMSTNDRGFANMSTGYALIEISKHGGPRCCKRDSITSIKSFMKVTGWFDGLEKAEYKCRQYSKNKDCIFVRCPYFPVAKT